MKMNRIWLPLSIFSFGLFALVSCDVIEDPIKDNGGPDGPCESTRTDTINPTTSYPNPIMRNALIEDFTGHRCKNCPKATKEIEAIKGDLGEDVIVLAIHSGSSAFTDPSPPEYPADFTTQDGDDIADYFGGVPGQPIGMVNRVDYPGGVEYWEIYPTWRSHAEPFLSQEAIADLWVMGYISTDCIITNVQATFMGDQTGDFGIAVYLKENGIVAPQLLSNDTRDPNYVHNNVFRDAISFATGEAFFSGSATDKMNVYRTFKSSLDSEWNPGNLQVVAVLFDINTREVLQVTQAAVQQ